MAAFMSRRARILLAAVVLMGTAGTVLAAKKKADGAPGESSFSLQEKKQ